MGFIRRTWQYVLLVLIVSGGTTLFWQRDTVLDHFALQGYTPTGEVKQLAKDTTMMPDAIRLFYVNHPQIEGRDEFNTHCTNTTDQVATLGCYTGNRNGIYLYKVTDPRLSGVEQVTAAHEMLHQAYDRLSKGQREHINKLLESFNAQLTDPIIKNQMDSYKTLEPSELVNEMHSIFGTEIKDLPPELETYYQRYFADRKKIADYYLAYQGEFAQRRQQIQTYDDQLTAIKKQIDAHKTSLDAREQVLKVQRAQLDKYLANNQIVEYNAAVPGFNVLVNGYRAEVNQTNGLINSFNSILDARNAIAVQERQLQQALDSHVDTATGQ